MSDRLMYRLESLHPIGTTREVRHHAGRLLALNWVQRAVREATYPCLRGRCKAGCPDYRGPVAKVDGPTALSQHPCLAPGLTRSPRKSRQSHAPLERLRALRTIGDLRSAQ